MEVEAGVKIIRRRIKHARLRVREDTSVELVVPQDLSNNEIDAILRRKEAWIERHRVFFRSRPLLPFNLANREILLFGDPYCVVTDRSLRYDAIVDDDKRLVCSSHDLMNVKVREKWYRHFARNYLSARVDQLAKEHRFLYRRLFVRSQRTRWGSCTVKRNICLNWRLIMAPKYVIDYLILHELMHTRVMKHTHAFWVQLRAICPDHNRATTWLHQNSPALSSTHTGAQSSAKPGAKEASFPNAAPPHLQPAALT
jgi:predicted metal-dependent hydrolase